MLSTSIVRMLTTVAVFALASCSDPTAPSEATFRAVIAGVLEKDAKEKKPYGEHSRQYCEKLMSTDPFTSSYGNNPVRDAFERAGYVEAYQQKNLLGNMDRRYRVNDNGLRTLFGLDPSDPEWNSFRNSLWVCVADGAELLEIVNWDEPSDRAGMTATTVTYKYGPKGKPAWITPELEPHITHLRMEHEAKIRLKLTAKGWEPVKW